MNSSLISNRYAKALMDYAESIGQDTKLYSEMRLLDEAFDKVRELGKAMRNQLVSVEQRKSLLTTAAGGNVSDAFSRFLEMLSEKERFSNVHQISLKYCELYRQRHNIHYCVLTTAIPLTDEELKHISDEITKFSPSVSELEIRNDVDESVLGGFAIETDSKLLDATVRHQLQEIKNVLVGNNQILN